MSRIIAGSAKGATIRTPRGDATRPTTDRVREAIFSALISWAGSTDAEPSTQLQGIGFLDLFAGSGAVGLEAASRGASPVTLVERDAATASLIRTNAATLRLDAQVVANQVMQFLGRAPMPFDIIFLDPPYDLPNRDIETCLNAIANNDWLVDDGIIVVERSSRTPPFAWPSELERQWLKVYGETVIYYGDRGVDPMLGEHPQSTEDPDLDRKEAADAEG